MVNTKRPSRDEVIHKRYSHYNIFIFTSSFCEVVLYFYTYFTQRFHLIFFCTPVTIILFPCQLMKYLLIIVNVASYTNMIKKTRYFVCCQTLKKRYSCFPHSYICLSPTKGQFPETLVTQLLFLQFASIWDKIFVFALICLFVLSMFLVVTIKSTFKIESRCQL